MLIPRLEEKFASLTGGLAGRANTISSGKLSSKSGGGFLIGALIGLVWTPCAGPIMAVALLQVIQSQTNLDAVATIGAFSIGAGIPMLIVGYSGQALTKYIRALARHAVTIRRAMGVVIVIFSLMGLFGFNLAEWYVTKVGATEQITQRQNALVHGLEQPYAAPPITGITQWLNSEPLDLASLKGKVVLIDFWTYSCINCIRTFPHIKSWHEKYKDDGLVIIGVHAPEFAFEGKPKNVEKALKKFGITYPVAMDNNFSTWKNFENKYWPAHYLIDRQGQVVYTHFGEGQYDITENNIRYLLGKEKEAKLDTGGDFTSDDQTHETYLGTDRAKNEIHLKSNKNIPLHHWALEGAWLRTGEHIETTKTGDTLTLHYRAKKVFLVMESTDNRPKTVNVIRDGKEKTLTITDSKLYEIVVDQKSSESVVTIKSQNPGLRLFAFTFES